MPLNILPFHRYPWTLESLPLKVPFYVYTDKLLVTNDNSAVLVEDESEIVTTRSRILAPSFLKITKTPEGFEVIAWNLMHHRQFLSLAAEINAESLSGQEKTFPVISYKERGNSH